MPTIDELRDDYLPREDANRTRALIALLHAHPIGVMQSYVVMHAGDARTPAAALSPSKLPCP